MAKDRNEGRLDTVVGPETSVKGDLRVGGSLRLDGQVEGRVDVTEAFVTGPKASLRGDVHCREAVIAGRIEGDVFAAEDVELQTGAQVFGNISSKGLVIQPDCVFQGNCSRPEGA
jgi:cytoskeletal protein CcmA (bactofilin family)